MGGGEPLLIRWTSDFDCGYETNWWYEICDEPFDVGSLKAKRRNVINNGIKYCEVKEIKPLEFTEELFEVFYLASKTYGIEANKPSFINYLRGLTGPYVVYGAFFRESSRLCGYAVINYCSNYIELQSQKAIPEYEKFQVNAALVYTVLEAYKDSLCTGKYICDGARSIVHKTNFQTYLEKYFGFRKAFCKLHLIFNPKIRWLIRALYPFRQIMKKIDGINSIRKLSALLQMEEIVRNQKELE